MSVAGACTFVMVRSINSHYRVQPQVKTRHAEFLSCGWRSASILLRQQQRRAAPIGLGDDPQLVAILQPIGTEQPPAVLE